PLGRAGSMRDGRWIAKATRRPRWGAAQCTRLVASVSTCFTAAAHTAGGRCFFGAWSIVLPAFARTLRSLATNRLRCFAEGALSAWKAGAYARPMALLKPIGSVTPWQAAGGSSRPMTHRTPARSFVHGGIVVVVVVDTGLVGVPQDSDHIPLPATSFTSRYPVSVTLGL